MNNILSKIIDEQIIQTDEKNTISLGHNCNKYDLACNKPSNLQSIFFERA